ncbi:hypothetical protein SLA2020_500230 [Shorea laevis]
MDRTREARRVTLAATAAAAAAATNGGLSRRRHRSSSLRDSPEDDGPVELQETVRLRDRGSGKKDRDRDRERERERDRERERERERDRDRDRDRERDRDRLSRTSKRRRADRLISNREDGVEDSSEESVNDDEDDDDDDGGGGGSSVRMLPPNAGSLSSSSLNHHHHQQPHHHRKSFPPPAKVFRATPPVTSPWKSADEMIGVSVPRKARSACTKRSHECWQSSGGAGVIGGEQIHRQASTSPVRPVVAGILASPPPAPASPSSSNASVRKKMKPNGPKQRLVKTSSKSPSSAQDGIEIEIAEVLFGMSLPQGPSKQDGPGGDSIKFDSREVNKPSSDAKSRVSSPISNSASAVPQSSSILPPNSNSSAAPMSAIAPKRKRPRPVKYEDENPSNFPVRNSSISSTAKVEVDQPAKIETTSPNLEKNSGSVAENGENSYDLLNSQATPASQPETAKPENSVVPDSKPSTEESERRDVSISKKDESRSPKKESSPSPPNPATGLRLDDEREKLTVTKAKSSESERQREEKFQIDLMAPPPSRSSPERDGEIDFDIADPKSIATSVGTEMKTAVKEDDKGVKFNKEDLNSEGEDRKRVKDEAKTIDLQLELEKSDKDGLAASLHVNKLSQHVQKQQHQQTSAEKTGQPASLPLPMSMATSWPGALPPMGYMAPLQGVVSMDGSTVPSASIQPPHLILTQPRPKRCATHCYIARNIQSHQQFFKNPFWPAAAGSASLYGAKACNLNVVPSTELHGNISGRVVNSVQEKGQGIAMFPGHVNKDKGPQAGNIVDAQRKQIMLQQALLPAAPSNILHAPAFIFPMSQQQAPTAASVRPGSVKSPPTAGTAPSSTSNSASVTATPAGPATGPAMSFNYTNLPGNETPYLAILPNNGYSFPIPAHVGAPPAYRGPPAQAMLFNGSFYSSQMLHPSQLQQQQQQPLIQSQQSQQGVQNTSMSSGSSSQKHLQNQQQRPHGNSGGAGNLQVFPAPKTQSSQQLQPHQRQSQHGPQQARQLEGEIGSEDSPSTADTRVSRANINIYSQNFAVPIQPTNYALMTAPSMGGPTSTSNHGEKKQPQPPLQQQGSKAGVDPFTSPAFALSFASTNGTAPGLDISSFTQNHAVQNYHQIMAAAAASQAAQQKKNFHVPEEGKRGTNDASHAEEERKSNAGKVSATVGQSIAFSRPDLSDASVSQIPGNAVIDSSARSINLGSASARVSGSVVPASIGNVNTSNAQQRNQQQQQQQQMLQFQKQPQFAARNKTPVTSNGSTYSDHPPPSSMASKFPSAFPQNLVQSSSSPAQSSQWKSSARTTTTQVPSPSLSSSNSASVKTLSQQGRPQQSQTHISFASNQKSSTQGQPPSSTQSPSPPVMVGSPTTSSISKSAGGSPRTTGSTSTGNKGGQSSTLSSQQAKNSPSVHIQKSSPVGGRNVSPILGNPQITSSLSTGGTKPQVAQQQQQKHAFPQTQVFFSSPYMQAQAQQHSATTSPSAPAATAFYLQRNQNEQQQLPGSSTASSTQMFSLRPVALSSGNTADPAKAAAGGGGNMKGGGLPSQGLIHAAQFAAVQSSGKPHQLVSAAYPYVNAVPAAVQVKPAEQKQPAA